MGSCYLEVSFGTTGVDTWCYLECYLGVTWSVTWCYLGVAWRYLGFILESCFCGPKISAFLKLKLKKKSPGNVTWSRACPCYLVAWPTLSYPV